MSFCYPHYASDLTDEMLTMPAERLAELSRYPLRVFATKQDIYQWLARTLADELKTNNAAGKPTVWILPVGPKDQYPLLADICNAEGISWKNLYAFHMDEYLDWQGRPVPVDHPFSFRGYCQRHIYDLLDPALRPPADQIIFPSIYDIDGFSRRLAEVGGADTVFGGFGHRGLFAFIETPSTRWHKVSVEELAASKTRVVRLRDETIIALSQRMTGGDTQHIPPMAVTLGMADILGSKKIRLICDLGSWKQYMLRVLLLTTERDANLPVTLCHGHPDVEVITDAASMEPLSLGL